MGVWVVVVFLEIVGDKQEKWEYCKQCLYGQEGRWGEREAGQKARQVAPKDDLSGGLGLRVGRGRGADIRESAGDVPLPREAWQQVGRSLPQKASSISSISGRTSGLWLGKLLINHIHQLVLLTAWR